MLLENGTKVSVYVKRTNKRMVGVIIDRQEVRNPYSSEACSYIVRWFNGIGVGDGWMASDLTVEGV